MRFPQVLGVVAVVLHEPVVRGGELAGLRCEEEAGFSGKLDKRKFIDVVADVMQRRMETDPSVVVMGEDVHRLKGGTNGATRGLRDNFPDRVLGTPISVDLR